MPALPSHWMVAAHVYLVNNAQWRVDSKMRPATGTSSHGSSQQTNHQQAHSVKEPVCPRGWSARFRLAMRSRREAVARAWRGVKSMLARAVYSIPGVGALLRWVMRRSASTGVASMRRTGSELFESQAGAAVLQIIFQPVYQSASIRFWCKQALGPCTAPSCSTCCGCNAKAASKALMIASSHRAFNATGLIHAARIAACRHVLRCALCAP